MNVVARRPQVSIAAAVHDQGFVAAGEDVAESLALEPNCYVESLLIGRPAQEFVPPARKMAAGALQFAVSGCHDTGFGGLERLGFQARMHELVGQDMRFERVGEGPSKRDQVLVAMAKPSALGHVR
jgi:hypothetical protein